MISPLDSLKVDPTNADFIRNKEAMVSLIQKLRDLAAKAREGGGKVAVTKHKSRGKLLPRERIAQLLDKGSAFLELSPLAGEGVYGPTLKVPSAGLVTGIGKVNGKNCMIVANDATVKGGTYFPLTVKKHLRAQEIALENILPCIYLVDSGGAYLPMQSELFPDKEGFGRIFRNEAVLSSKGIPQVAIVFGSCTAGGAYVPAMADEAIIVRNTGSIFLAGPPLVKAATGEEVSTEELGGADVHTRVSGVADHAAENETHALSIAREILSRTGEIGTDVYSDANKIEEPLLPVEDLLGLIPKDPRKHFDAKHIITRIVDGSKLAEFKSAFAPTVVCGFAKIHGMPIGIVANNGVLFSGSALKATHFIQMCDRRNIPLLFLQNITGFVVGKNAEAGGIAKDGAKLVTAVSCVKVPKITLVTGASFGAGNYAMCGRAYDPRFLFMWPNARIAVMGGDQAASVLAQVKMNSKTQLDENSDDQKKKQEIIRKKYENEGNAFYSTAHLWDDGIIEPQETRKVLAFVLKVINSGLKQKHPKQSPFGIFRM